MASYAFRLNGRSVSAESWDPAQPLLYLLRNAFSLHGAKFGCGLGQCGTCTVMMDGKAVRSCQTRVDRAAGHAITTIEGLGAPASPNRLQSAFIAEQAAQCGYCTNGMIMTAKALLDREKSPSEAAIKHALAGNLCRCGSHNRIVHAVRRASVKL